MEETKEKSLQRESSTIEISEKITPFSELDPEVQLAIKCAFEKQALDLVALDLRQIASFTEFFVIASGSNQRQVQAIADNITEQLKDQLNVKPVRVEGYTAAEWILVDFGDFIFHIFDRNARDFYDLDRLWRDATKVDVPKDNNE